RHRERVEVVRSRAAVVASPAMSARLLATAPLGALTPPPPAPPPARPLACPDGRFLVPDGVVLVPGAAVPDALTLVARTIALDGGCHAAPVHVRRGGRPLHPRWRNARGRRTGRH